ncbi:major facilitator superfamily domain-containing protein [Cristinia sonorae]|uniref:Major facilitator superfamily domain-containing protein n=1 Tax=Cristinia sonorae TaxID=1940300 RepID=A0A8K0XQP0_9AGAR|nr:major facilitator superfamily domain-containing protein [Cristinia sonorae]
MATTLERTSNSSKTDHESRSVGSTSKEQEHLVEDVPSEVEDPSKTLTATLTAAGAFLVYFTQFGVLNSAGVLQSQYATDQLKGINDSKISWIGTFQLFFYFFGGSFVGPCFDAVGPTVLLIVGSFLIIFGHMMVSLCKEYYQFFLAQGVVIGFGGAMVFYPALSSSAQWYEKKRGTMLGITTCGTALGAVVFPIALNKLIVAVGFPWAVRIIGFICLGLLTPATLMIRARLPRRGFTGFRNVVDFGGLKESGYLLSLIGAFVLTLGLFQPLFFSETFSIERNYNINISLYDVAILNAGAFFGRLFPGILADRFGPVNMVALFCTLAGITFFCWLSIVSPAGFVVWVFFYGVVSGAYITLLPACIAQFTPDMSTYGARTGLFFGIVSFAALAGPPIAGAILDAGGQGATHFNNMIYFSGSLTLAGAMLFWVARFVNRPRLLSKY